RVGRPERGRPPGAARSVAAPRRALPAPPQDRRRPRGGVVNGITLTGPELVFYGIAAVVLVAALWLAWRVLLAAVGIVGAEWLVIHYAAGNLTLLLTVL